ncbi:MAG: hypothetical protein ACFFCQ_11130 [Promethearchaeota archaeon]
MNALQKRCITNNAVIGVIATGGFLLFRWSSSPWYIASLAGLGDYETHVLVNTFFYLIIPLLFLSTTRSSYYFTTEEGLKRRNLAVSFGWGCGIHLFIFFPWFGYFVFEGLKPGFISWYVSPLHGLPLYMLTVVINVTTVEYFTKAFCQLQIEEAFNKKIAFIAQFFYWLAGHIIEYLWLVEYTGIFHAVGLIVVSGLLTGLLVSETENIYGVTVGHILLNVLAMILAIHYYGI